MEQHKQADAASCLILFFSLFSCITKATVFSSFQIFVFQRPSRRSARYKDRQCHQNVTWKRLFFRPFSSNFGEIQDSLRAPACQKETKMTDLHKRRFFGVKYQNRMPGFEYRINSTSISDEPLPSQESMGLLVLEVRKSIEKWLKKKKNTAYHQSNNNNTFNFGFVAGNKEKD